MTISANWRNTALLLILTALTGCNGLALPPAASGVADIEGPSHPIRRVGDADRDWPTLSDVPTERPVRPSDAAGELAQQRQLEADRTAATAAAERLHTGGGINDSAASWLEIPASPPSMPDDL